MITVKFECPNCKRELEHFYNVDPKEQQNGSTILFGADDLICTGCKNTLVLDGQLVVGEPEPTFKVRAKN